MPYAPSVNDRSGEIIAEAKMQADKIRALEQQQMWQGIADGISNISEGISEGMSKARENAIKYDTAAGMLETYKQNANSLGLDLAMLDGLDQKLSKDPDKVIGALTVVGRIAENNLSMQRQSAQVEGYKDLADYKASVGPGTDTTSAPPKLDSNYARQFYQGLRENGRSHEQALADMDSAGLNWGKPYIEGQKNPFFP